MKKEYFKLRIKGHTNNQCRKILFAKYNYEINIRTLRRWIKRLNESKWDIQDKSKRPKRIHKKIAKKIENKVIFIRNKTGFRAEKIENFVNLSHTFINKIPKKNKLTATTKQKKKRIKYIRFQHIS